MSRLAQHARVFERIAQGVGSAVRFDRAFRRFLDASGPAPLVQMPVRSPALVVVQPWVSATAVPWHLFAFARLLGRRNGNTAMLWDDTVVFPRDLPARAQSVAIARLLRRIGLPSWRLGHFAGQSPLPVHELRLVARMNAIKVYRGEEWPLAQERLATQLEARLRGAAASLDSFLTAIRPEYLVIIGGLFSTSGVYPALARRHGIRLASMDFGAGIFQLSVDGIAAHLDDIPATIASLGSIDRVAVDRARAEFEQRRRGADRFSFQKVAAGVGDGEGVGALLPLNQSHDGAALGVGSTFATQDEWLMATVRWLLDETNERIVIRQHPCERFDRGNDDYAARLRRHFGDTPRIRFIAAADSVNTYDLVMRAKVVLPHSSSVGIEATGMGVPVVVASDCYYARLGIVWRGATRLEYFQRIQDALAGRLSVDDDRRDRAWTCYYFTTVASFFPCGFTPFAEDYARWSKTSLQTLWGDQAVQDILTAVDDGIPLPVVQHRREVAMRGRGLP